MFVSALQMIRTQRDPISRLCWTSVVAGSLALVLFLLPMLLHWGVGSSTMAVVGYGLAWLASGIFGVMALYTGYVSQWRLRSGERHSMVCAVCGGAMGLASLILESMVLLGMAYAALAS